ncbi:MAG: M28 family peptidase [Planctomycetota bacterium]
MITGVLRWAAHLTLAVSLSASSACVNITKDTWPAEGPTAQQVACAQRLATDVSTLCDDIGVRSLWNQDGYDEAAQSIGTRFEGIGLRVRQHELICQLDGINPEPVVCVTLEAEVPGFGSTSEIVLIGAHYDSYRETVGANDNASGVAVLLELAKRFAHSPRHRTIRFVAFANEEPPFFQSDGMGSLAYARACREAGDAIVAMIALDGLGYYSDKRGTQRYPFPAGIALGPKADFIAFVGRLDARPVVDEALTAFRSNSALPANSYCFPGWVQGVGWSDQWSFWQAGYTNSFMVTDTLPFRYKHYHEPTDTPDRLDYDAMARLTDGLEAVIDRLAAPDQ